MVSTHTEKLETAQWVRARFWLKSQTIGVWSGSTSWMTLGFSYANGDNYRVDVRINCGRI